MVWFTRSFIWDVIWHMLSAGYQQPSVPPPRHMQSNKNASNMWMNYYTRENVGRDWFLEKYGAESIHARV
jgi:hypothetical protein